MKTIDYKQMILEHYDESFTDSRDADCIFDYLGTFDGYEIGWARECPSHSVDPTDLFYYADFYAIDRVVEWIKQGKRIHIAWDLDVEYGIDWDLWAEELGLVIFE